MEKNPQMQADQKPTEMFGPFLDFIDWIYPDEARTKSATLRGT